MVAGTASTTGERGTSLPVRCWRYDLGIRKAYWKQFLIVAVLAVLVISVVLGNIHGSRQYDAGYAQAEEDRKAEEDKVRQYYEQEKVTNEREAQQRIDRARNDALDAAASAGRLQQQLFAIREQLRQYNAIVGAGSSAADTGVLLADVLSKSREKQTTGRVC